MSERCTRPASQGHTCLQALAEGWVLASDLCPRCTRRFMAALDQAAGEPLAWHRTYTERAEHPADQPD